MYVYVVFICAAYTSHWRTKIGLKIKNVDKCHCPPQTVQFLHKPKFFLVLTDLYYGEKILP